MLVLISNLKAKLTGYRRLSLTYGAHSVPWLPPVWSSSESEQCPGSGQGERSAVGHAACRWSSAWSHQSTTNTMNSEVKWKIGGLKYKIQITLWVSLPFYDQCINQVISNKTVSEF